MHHTCSRLSITIRLSPLPVISRPRSQDLPGKKTVTGLSQWMAEKRGADKRFSFIADLLTSVLPAVDLMYRGTRSNNTTAHDAGRKEALNLLIMRGAVHYIPLLARDIRDKDFLCPPEARPAPAAPAMPHIV